MYCMQQFLLVWILLVVVMSFIRCVSPLNVSVSVSVKGGCCCVVGLWISGWSEPLFALTHSPASTLLLHPCMCVCVSVCCGTDIDEPSLPPTTSSLQQHTAANDRLLIGWELSLIMNMHTYSQSTQLRGCSHSSMLIGCRNMVSFSQLIENCSYIVSTSQHIWRRRECFRCGLRRGSHF